MKLQLYTVKIFVNKTSLGNYTHFDMNKTTIAPITIIPKTTNKIVLLPLCISPSFVLKSLAFDGIACLARSCCALSSLSFLDPLHVIKKSG